MKLSDYLASEGVVILTGSTKAEVLHELVALLARKAGLDCDQVEAIVWDREKLMSTGIGHGLAIPHVRLAGLSTPQVAVGVSRQGIPDYESMDGDPVRIVVLILAPQGQHETHIRLLAAVAEALKQKEVVRAILEAEDPGTVYDVLVGAEK
ncbi:MAG TPA: PTS sugar transporter subunit IIA [Phycisphaerae bacterium]|nr:PTS sugar transporter subunit IIA [Phycisphaerae bacterium]